MVAARTTSLTQAQILKTLREHDAQLKEFSVRKIGLFGSYAKGSETNESDIDLLVEFENATYDNFYSLIEYLEVLFGKRVEILTPSALETMRVEEVADSIRESVVYV
jgi:predicted nucleotidyltransferase